MTQRTFSLRIVVSSLVILFGTFFIFGTFSAFAGVLDNIKPKSKASASPSVSRNELDILYKLVSDADYLLFKSLSATRIMLSNKEEKFELKKKMESIETIKNPQEREAEMRKFNADSAS
jgi:hypothetical protein